MDESSTGVSEISGVSTLKVSVSVKVPESMIGDSDEVVVGLEDTIAGIVASVSVCNSCGRSTE